MTAEIVIMNKSAIALAADSAVTIGEKKIYNTVNKLFALSKYHPVGIMVYGSAEFMEVPWETIIKVFRNELGKQRFNRLEDYSDKFINFLNRKNPLFSEDVQRKSFELLIRGYFFRIKGDVDKEVKLITDTKGIVKNSDVSKITSDVILRHWEMWKKFDDLKSTSSFQAGRTVRKYNKLVNEARSKILQKLPISKKSMLRLFRLCEFLLYKDNFSSRSSGVVIAGFGEEEIFPKTVKLELENKIDGRVKYSMQTKEITVSNSASIMPFAQREMVDLFMSGIDPSFDMVIDGYLKEIFERFPMNVADSLVQLNESEKAQLTENLKKVGKALLDRFNDMMNTYKRNNHVSPILDSVAALPKDELAAMAEALVNLTSFKRRVTMSAETVGGPIDVAVISKGDGLIWIKRKHYFKPELNPQFFENYFKVSGEGGR
ncbi:MAG TPA: hypothetical protein VMU88_00635 [bacterium]|nr:hypothetical protein [bacterium]